ncbi:MAG TPA: hypothetical protein PK625_09805, partial [Spirochaetales bacterium]|nr:hypothetical protein [Spirochaetales bacterium]
MNNTAINELFSKPLSALNLGLQSFADNLAAAGAPVVHVDWKPPAGGDTAAMAALDRLAAGARVDIEAANAEAVRRILSAKPTVTGIGLALDTVPGLCRSRWAWPK